MASIGESTKIFLQDLIEYALQGNEVLVKTENILLSTRVYHPFIAWVFVYKGERLSLIEDISSFTTVNEKIFKFINNVDKELNDDDS